MGRNDARVVVSDAFGGSREVSTSYYLTTSALARGVHDYQYSVGFRRRALGSTSWDYASPAALARHRVGLTDSVTPAGQSAGAIPQPHRSPLLDARSERAAGAPPAEASVFGSAAVNRRLSLTAQHNRSTYRSFTRDRSSLVADVHISRYVELTSSATWGREADEPDRELFAGLTFLFGRSSAAFSTIRDAGATRSMIETQRPLPVGTGYGYQFRAEWGAKDLVSGQGRYQNQYGRYELRRDVIAGEAQTALSAAGAMVGIGGRIFASRPVYESFAVIDVPGIEGVRGFASNQEVGRTARGGQLLVPDLQAYYGNLLSIADSGSRSRAAHPPPPAFGRDRAAALVGWPCSIGAEPSPRFRCGRPVASPAGCGCTSMAGRRTRVRQAAGGRRRPRGDFARGRRRRVLFRTCLPPSSTPSWNRATSPANSASRCRRSLSRWSISGRSAARRPRRVSAVAGFGRP